MTTRPRTSKTLGQHFLIDSRTAERIVGALDPRPGEAVLEIGPGTGALTGRLIHAAGRIAAVELDRELAAALATRFGPERLVLLVQDVLTLELAVALEALGCPRDGRLVLAGNLPYQISKPVSQKLIRARANISRAVLMFQREVARRLTASPGSREYGPLGVLAGMAYEIHILFDLAPGAFRPIPAVWSSVTSWRPRPGGFPDAEDEARLRACLAACFSRRRQTLRNNLRAALGGQRELVEGLLARAGIDGALRAEAVPPSGFLRLAAEWPRGRIAPPAG